MLATKRQELHYMAELTRRADRARTSNGLTGRPQDLANPVPDPCKGLATPLQGACANLLQEVCPPCPARRAGIAWVHPFKRAPHAYRHPADRPCPPTKSRRGTAPIPTFFARLFATSRTDLHHVVRGRHGLSRKPEGGRRPARHRLAPRRLRVFTPSSPRSKLKPDPSHPRCGTAARPQRTSALSAQQTDRAGAWRPGSRNSPAGPWGRGAQDYRIGSGAEGSRFERLGHQDSRWSSCPPGARRVLGWQTISPPIGRHGRGRDRILDRAAAPWRQFPGPSVVEMLTEHRAATAARPTWVVAARGQASPIPTDDRP